MTSYIIFTLTILAGIITVASSVISSMLLISRKHRRKRLMRRIIFLINSLSDENITNNHNSYINKQLDKLILELIQLDVRNMRIQYTSSLTRRMKLLENGYSSKRMMEKDLSELLSQANEIDTGQELKSA